MAVIMAVIGVMTVVVTLGSIVCIVAFIQGYQEGPNKVIKVKGIAAPTKPATAVVQPKKRFSTEPTYNEEGGIISGGKREPQGGLWFVIIFIIAVFVWHKINN